MRITAMFKTIHLASIVGALASACGGPQATPAAPAPVSNHSAVPGAPSASASTLAVASAAPSASMGAVAWKDMTAPQRKEYMSTVVLPKMKEEFAQFNAQAYTDMNCVTCHGDGAKNGKFGMPNPDLPKLPGDQAGFEALMNKKPVVMRFMASKVVPDMAHFVGESPYNPETQQGFGCFECHTKKQDPVK